MFIVNKKNKMSYSDSESDASQYSVALTINSFLSRELENILDLHYYCTHTLGFVDKLKSSDLVDFIYKSLSGELFNAFNNSWSFNEFTDEYISELEASFKWLSDICTMEHSEYKITFREWQQFCYKNTSC